MMMMMMTSFLFLDIEKNQENLNTFENIMENKAFAPKYQMLHFPQYFQICCSSKASKRRYYGAKC